MADLRDFIWNAIKTSGKHFGPSKLVIDLSRGQTLDIEEYEEYELNEKICQLEYELEQAKNRIEYLQNELDECLLERDEKNA